MWETIDRCALFLGCRDDEKQAIADIATEHTYPDGTMLVCAGDPGHTLYLIKEGSVEVIVPGEGGAERVVAELRASDSLMEQYTGGYFGEMSLIDVEARSASIRAKGPVTVLSIPARKLAEVFRANKDLHLTVILNIARILSRRLREANARWGT